MTRIEFCRWCARVACCADGAFLMRERHHRGNPTQWGEAVYPERATYFPRLERAMSHAE